MNKDAEKHSCSKCKDTGVIKYMPIVDGFTNYRWAKYWTKKCDCKR